MLSIICSSTLCKKLKRNTSAYNCDSPIILSKWSYHRRQNWGRGLGEGPIFFFGGGGGVYSIAPPLSISFRRHCLQSVWKKESGIINHIKHISKENVGQKNGVHYIYSSILYIKKGTSTFKVVLLSNNLSHSLFDRQNRGSLITYWATAGIESEVKGRMPYCWSHHIKHSSKHGGISLHMQCTTVNITEGNSYSYQSTKH